MLRSANLGDASVLLIACMNWKRAPRCSNVICIGLKLKLGIANEGFASVPMGEIFGKTNDVFDWILVDGNLVNELEPPRKLSPRKPPPSAVDSQSPSFSVGASMLRGVIMICRCVELK